jgi:hypothetical protein
MKEELYNLLTTAIVTTGIVALISLPVSCSINKDKIINEMVKNGTDPILAKCAVSDNGIPAECVLRKDVIKL